MGGLKWMDYLFFFGINLFFCFETSQRVWFQWEVWILLFLIHLRVLGDVVSIFVFTLNSIKHFTVSHHCNFSLTTPEVDCSILWGTKEMETGVSQFCSTLKCHFSEPFYVLPWNFHASPREKFPKRNIIWGILCS